MRVLNGEGVPDLAVPAIALMSAFERNDLAATSLSLHIVNYIIARVVENDGAVGFARGCGDCPPDADAEQLAEGGARTKR